MKTIFQRGWTRRGFVKAVAMGGGGLALWGAGLRRAYGQRKRYRVGIDIGYHPLWAYLDMHKDEYFRGKGYEIDMIVLDSLTLPTAFAKGELDVMTTPVTKMIHLKEQTGIDTQYFWPLARWVAGEEVVVAKDSPYKSLTDLKGKKMALRPLAAVYGTTEAAFYGFTGQRLQDFFQLVETEQSAQELEMGRVDAAWITAIFVVPLVRSGKFRVLTNTAELWRKALKSDLPVLSGGFIARPEFITAEKQFVIDWCAVNRQVWLEYKKNPDKINDDASKKTGVPKPRIEGVGNFLGLKASPDSQIAVLEEDVKQYEEILLWMEKVEAIKKRPADVKKLFILTKDLGIRI